MNRHFTLSEDELRAEANRVLSAVDTSAAVVAYDRHSGSGRKSKARMAACGLALRGIAAESRDHWATVWAIRRLLWPKEDDKLTTTEAMLVAAVARWADIAFPTLLIPGKLAAALASTETHDFNAPWNSFMVEFPEDSFGDSGIDYVILSSTNVGTWDVFIEYNGSMHGMFDLAPQRLGAGGFCDGVTPIGGDKPWPAEKSRLFTVACRAIAGACVALDNSGDTVGCSVTRKRGPKGQRVQPRHLRERWVLSRPVKCDLRPQVREYVNGTNTRLYQSRWLVRGHWRLQACGKGLERRKRLWIQPHWKGPDHAPTLVREHHLCA